MKRKHGQKNSLPHSRGFTLIEIMIAVALFTIIMILGIGAVLKISQIHKKTQNVRNVLDNLDFVMEDMTRNIRLGGTYHCNIYTGTIDTVNNCLIISGQGPLFSLALEKVGGDPATPDDQLVYRLVNVGTYYEIMKGTGTDRSKDQVLTPAEIHIFPSSGFNVVNAGNASGLQPTVTIRLNGEVVYQDIKTPFNLQTTITDRQINCDATCNVTPIQ